jgi:hypothetical protein
MELILGLPPMTQYDAAATPMWKSFTENPNYTIFNHLSANIDLNEKNGQNKMTALSERFDWSKEDKVPDLSFNEILWQGIKGINSPAPSRAAFVKVSKEE